jgi:hypothetical protein
MVAAEALAPKRACGGTRTLASHMPASAPNAALQRRIETMIRIFSPLLDLVLAVGDRVSRVLEPDDPDYVPVRMPSEGESAPRGLRPRH